MSGVRVGESEGASPRRVGGGGDEQGCAGVVTSRGARTDAVPARAPVLARTIPRRPALRGPGTHLCQMQLGGLGQRAQQRGLPHRKEHQAGRHALHQRARHCRGGWRRGGCVRPRGAPVLARVGAVQRLHMCIQHPTPGVPPHPQAGRGGAGRAGRCAPEGTGEAGGGLNLVRYSRRAWASSRASSRMYGLVSVTSSGASAPPAPPGPAAEEGLGAKAGAECMPSSRSSAASTRALKVGATASTAAACSAARGGASASAAPPGRRLSMLATLRCTSCRQLHRLMLRSCAALQAPPTARRSGPEAAMASAFCAISASACPTVAATCCASSGEPAGHRRRRRAASVRGRVLGVLGRVTPTCLLVPNARSARDRTKLHQAPAHPPPAHLPPP